MIFFISCWNNPIRELNTVVTAPNHKHINNAVELYSIKGDERINKYTPAVHLCWLSLILRNSTPYLYNMDRTISLTYKFVAYVRSMYAHIFS